MSGFLLDTNCISEVVRLEPEPRVLRWLESAEENSLYLSTLTLGEIRKGIVSLEQGKRRRQPEEWLVKDLRMRFAGRILPVDVDVADRWGALAGELKRKGKPMAIIDSLLAATALHYSLTVVSRNVSDFQDVQVLVINPWDPA